MLHPLLWLVLVLVATVILGVVLTSCRSGPPTGARDVYAFTLTAIDGSPYPLDQLRGRPVLIVNTASRCGFTKQYDALEALYRRFAAQGLVIIAQPSNDFLHQEPGSDSDIEQFCRVRFGVTFPLMAKGSVSGTEALPLYRWLTLESAKRGSIKWNFTKFLIGRDGRVLNRFGPSMDPGDASVITAIESALAQPAPTLGGDH